MEHGGLKIKAGTMGGRPEFLPRMSRLARSHDQSAVFQYNFGVAYYKTGDKENAGKIWENARGLDPEYLEPLYGLSVL